MLPILSPTVAGKLIFEADNLNSFDINTHREAIPKTERRHNNFRTLYQQDKERILNPQARWRQIKNKFKTAGFLDDIEQEVNSPVKEEVDLMFESIVDSCDNPINVLNRIKRDQ